MRCVTSPKTAAKETTGNQAYSVLSGILLGSNKPPATPKLLSFRVQFKFSEERPRPFRIGAPSGEGVRVLYPSASKP